MAIFTVCIEKRLVTIQTRKSMNWEMEMERYGNMTTRCGSFLTISFFQPSSSIVSFCLYLFIITSSSSLLFSMSCYSCYFMLYNLFFRVQETFEYLCRDQKKAIVVFYFYFIVFGHFLLFYQVFFLEQAWSKN